jgi:hypothetical protein
MFHQALMNTINTREGTSSSSNNSAVGNGVNIQQMSSPWMLPTISATATGLSVLRDAATATICKPVEAAL